MDFSITPGTLFPLDNLPEGLLFQPDFLRPNEEAELIRTFRGLSFQAFDFHGYMAKRRVLEFGLEYDFTTRRATPTQSFPEFLLPVRERAAQFAGVSTAELVEGMVTEYSPGAPIGWHRDAPQFGTIIGISLAGTSRMRFKPYKAEGKPVALTLEPRSIYAMRGPVRWKFQHSIPPVKDLRYQPELSNFSLLFSAAQSYRMGSAPIRNGTKCLLGNTHKSVKARLFILRSNPASAC